MNHLYAMQGIFMEIALPVAPSHIVSFTDLTVPMARLILYFVAKHPLHFWSQTPT